MGEELKFVPGKGLLDGEEVVAEFDVRVLTIYYFISQTGKRVKKAYDIEATTFDGEKLDVQRVSNLQNLSYFDLWPQIIDAGLDRKQKGSAASLAADQSKGEDCEKTIDRIEWILCFRR